MSDEFKQDEFKPAGGNIIKNAGLKNGLLLFLLGGALVAFNLIMINSAQRVFTKLLALGMICLYVGIALLIEPGPREFEGNASKEIFDHANGFQKALWIFSVIVGIGAAIFVIICDTWEGIYGLFYMSFAVAGLLFAVKHLVGIFIQAGKNMSVEEQAKESDNTESKPFFDYYEPNLLFRVLAVVLGLLITAGSLYGFAKVTMELNVDDMISGKEPVSLSSRRFDNQIAAKLEDEVYFFPIEIEDGVTKGVNAIVDFSSDSEYESFDTVKLGDLVRQVIDGFDRNSKFNGQDGFSGFSGLIFYDSEKDTTYFYSAKDLEKIKAVKQYIKEHNSEDISYLNISINSSNTKDFFEENMDKLVVVSEPEYEYELMKVWTPEGFVDYLNGLFFADEEEKYTLDDFIYDYEDGYFDDTVYTLIDFQLFCYYTYEPSENYLNGMLVNFGTQDAVIYTSDSCSTVFSENYSDYDYDYDDYDYDYDEEDWWDL